MRHGAQQAAVNQSTNDNYKILVVDDEEGILDSLSIFLKRSGYQFVGITDPVEAIERVKQEHFDLLVLDFIMTPLHGDQVVEEIRKFNKELYILLLTGHKDLAPPLETIKRLDIQGYCEKSDKFDQVILLIESGIKSVAQMREIQRINEELKDTYEQLEKAYLESVQTIRYTVEAKDPYTRGHSDRVSAYSVLIGEKLGLSEKDLKTLRIGGLFHDVGKIGVPDAILQKESRLTDEEYSEIKNHPSIGAHILSTASIFKEIIPIVKHHHERYDGKSDKFDQVILLIESGIKSVAQMREIQRINEELKDTYEQLEKAYLESVQTIRYTVEAKDPYTRGHSDRVSAYSVLIGEKLGLSEKDLKTLRIGGLFHDVGKIGVPDAILQKESRLTDEEYSEIKNHPSIGAHILSTASIFKEIIPIVKHHHERYDGKGYPSQLKGDEIPYFARIAAIADSFDAMTSKRTYRNSLPIEVVIEEFKKGRGTQFDPELDDVFLDILEHDYDKIKSIQEQFNPNVAECL